MIRQIIIINNEWRKINKGRNKTPKTNKTRRDEKL